MRGRDKNPHNRFQKGHVALMTEPARKFARTFRGYAPAAVEAHIEMLSTKQHLLLDDIESLRAKLLQRGNEAAALQQEVAVLTDTSPSPHAIQKRMAQMLRRAVEEVSEMQAEARAEAEALIATAQAEVEAVQQEHNTLLAELTTRQENLKAEHQEAKKQLDAELADARADAQDEREQLLADAKQEADHYRDQARRSVEEAIRQRITILEQLTGVHRDLEAVPATLEKAYQELNNPSEESAPEESRQKVSAG
jgi:cell division septum initiation protein DivIVA